MYRVYTTKSGSPCNAAGETAKKSIRDHQLS